MPMETQVIVVEGYREVYSATNPDRAVAECLAGFVCYLREGDIGIRVGITNRQGAKYWLDGKPAGECGLYTVEG